jgi:SAM-dependent methyltransferase
MHWRIKGVTQKILSTVPGGTRLNDILQRTVGELRHFESHAAGRIKDWLIVASHLRELKIDPTGLRCMEIGTGWFPASPICFSLAGCGECLTYDLERHLDPSLTSHLLKLLEAHLPAIAEATSRPLAKIQADFADLRRQPTLPDVLRRARIDYRAPADATETGLPADTLDIVFSNNVLEHVPRDVLRGMMRETYRTLRSGGIVIHCVNCGDHYAYFDRKITAINYLTYGDSRWRFWDNKLLYQNRLRPQDFLDLAKEAGLEVILKKHKPKPELLDALPRLRIAAEFQRYPPEQLCCTSIDFVARKP